MARAGPHGDEQPAVRESVWRRVVRNPWRSFASAVALGSASILAQPNGPPPAVAAVKTATSIRKKSDPMAGRMLSVSMASGFMYFAWDSTRKDAKEEAVRINEETEALERMSKEFTDIDEAVTVDEDLMKSLKKRLNSTNASEDGDAPSGDGPSGGGDVPSGGGDLSGGGGGAAVLEPPSEPVEEPPTASTEEVERLNRMFGMGDAEK